MSEDYRHSIHRHQVMEKMKAASLAELVRMADHLRVYPPKLLASLTSRQSINSIVCLPGAKAIVHESKSEL